MVGAHGTVRRHVESRRADAVEASGSVNATAVDAFSFVAFVDIYNTMNSYYL